ncbi:MAG: TolC family protein, partial [Gemmatimonadota bacterium]
MSTPRPMLAACCAVVLLCGGLDVTPAAAQIAPGDSIDLSLPEALALGAERNPQIRQAGYTRSAAGAGVREAYGNFLPEVALQGQLQRTFEGTFNLFGREFQSPATYATQYQWDFSHRLLDSGRDFYRLKSARATVDREVAGYDLQAWLVASDVKTQYLNARRQQALTTQAVRERARLAEHVRLAQARYDVGAVTKSDILQAQLGASQGDVAVLQAAQTSEEALLALRRLLGGALPPGPIALTTDFQVFQPTFEIETLLASARASYPGLRRLEAQEDINEADLWIARSAYLPSLQFQYGLGRSVTDSLGFAFSGFDDRDFYAVSMNWPLFDGFSRRVATSQANAALQSTRAERQQQELTLEETVRTAHSRLLTAYAAWRANQTSVELAAEDLRLGEARYRTGAG